MFPSTNSSPQTLKLSRLLRRLATWRRFSTLTKLPNSSRQKINLLSSARRSIALTLTLCVSATLVAPIRLEPQARTPLARRDRPTWAVYDGLKSPLRRDAYDIRCSFPESSVRSAGDGGVVHFSGLTCTPTRAQTSSVDSCWESHRLTAAARSAAACNFCRATNFLRHGYLQLEVPD